MKINDLTFNIKSQLEQKLNIKNSLSIMNVPKQDLLEKGDLVVLLDDKNKPIICEFLKDGSYHVELKDITFPKMLVDSLLKSKATRIFETDDFNAEFDMDYYIDYSQIETNEKRDIRNFVKSAEKKLEESSKRFGKMDKQSLMKTITSQNGTFTVWMNENGHSIPDKKCLQEAFAEADKFHDFPLKKRAGLAKCFHKISVVRGTDGKSKN